jgi:hypothetical protein
MSFLITSKVQEFEDPKILLRPYSLDKEREMSLHVHTDVYLRLLLAKERKVAAYPEPELCAMMWAREHTEKIISGLEQILLPDITHTEIYLHTEFSLNAEKVYQKEPQLELELNKRGSIITVSGSSLIRPSRVEYIPKDAWSLPICFWQQVTKDLHSFTNGIEPRRWPILRNYTKLSNTDKTLKQALYLPR